MKRQDSGLEPELEAFLEHAKVERHLPAEMRARLLARGRAIVAAAEGGRRVPATTDPTLRPPASPVVKPGRAPFWIALAASIALAGAAIATAAVLHARSAQTPAAPLRESPAEAPIPPSVERPSAESPPRPAEPALRAHAARPGRAAAKEDPLAGELDLLQRAQAAYTRRDFSAALALAAEHARRFPKGHLAEQREALRVRSLLGAGRADEAHRAAAAFAARFPRSILLPRVAEDPESSRP